MIQCVQKTMRILAVISDGMNHPVPLQRIADTTGYPKPTCVHILETLCADGYVERVSHSDGYRLGLAMHHLTRCGLYDQELVALCRPILKWMERNSHATALLSVIRSNQKFIIDRVETTERIFTETHQIRLDDIYRTATGRAILAQMSREQVEEIYRRYGNPLQEDWPEVTSFESLCDELDAIREQPIVAAGGSHVVEGTVVKGYARPIFRGEECVGAVGLGWKYRLDEKIDFEKEESNIHRILMKGSREIQRRLSYEG